MHYQLIPHYQLINHCNPADIPPNTTISKHPKVDLSPTCIHAFFTNNLSNTTSFTHHVSILTSRYSGNKSSGHYSTGTKHSTFLAYLLAYLEAPKSCSHIPSNSDTAACISTSI